MEPLGLTSTYVGRRNSYDGAVLAKGYKPHFYGTEEYDAPEYRGNTPAGYIISSTEDMARWMRIQMGLEPIPESYRALIEKSHVGNSTVASSGDYYYAAGWSVHIRGEAVTHGGSNPNYSSELMIDEEKQIGLCALSNLDSNLTSYVSQNFFNALYHREPTSYQRDSYKSLDMVFFHGFLRFHRTRCILFRPADPGGNRDCQKAPEKGETEKGQGGRAFAGCSYPCLFGYCVYYLPNILFSRLPWEAVTVWGSESIPYGSMAGFFCGAPLFLLCSSDL